MGIICAAGWSPTLAIVRISGNVTVGKIDDGMRTTWYAPSPARIDDN